MRGIIFNDNLISPNRNNFKSEARIVFLSGPLDQFAEAISGGVGWENTTELMGAKRAVRIKKLHRGLKYSGGREMVVRWTCIKSP